MNWINKNRIYISKKIEQQRCKFIPYLILKTNKKFQAPERNLNDPLYVKQISKLLSPYHLLLKDATYRYLPMHLIIEFVCLIDKLILL